MKKLHSGGVMCEKSLVSLVLVLFLLAIFLLPRFYLFAFPCPFLLFPSLFSFPFALLLIQSIAPFEALPRVAYVRAWR